MEHRSKPTELAPHEAGIDDASDGVRALRRRADGVLAGQKEVLELALAGQPAAASLGVLVRTLEVQSHAAALAMLLRLDPVHALLRLGAGGSLPVGFHGAFDGLAVGPAAGPCAAAIESLAPVSIGDIAAEAGDWPSFRTLALAHGLNAAWAAPVLSSERQVLGVLVLLRREPQALPQEDLAAAQQVLHTAALVLERERRDAAVPVRRPDDEFLARLAHELRNPLAPLRNAIELISRPGVEPGMVDKACSIMSRQVTRLAALIDEMAAPAHVPPFSPMTPAAVPDPAPVALAVPAPPGRRVLVADDNDLVRESFVELLEREGYEVRTAVDGLQAVEIAEHWQPQVVMLDIHMPRLSGLETARRLRASHAPQVMTLLMMSGMSLNEAWIRHAKAAGFDDCLDKTGDPQRWLQRLRQALH